jgi:EAL and modified HD-GYP domain-containing signal transduction protein
MDIYVARQPIFNKHMRLYGYELLYRRSSNNFYEGVDHNTATADLVHNAFLVMGFQKLTDGTKGFINFTQDLLESEIPRILPKDGVVIEILEHVSADEAVVSACRKLKSDGYTLALDDFIFDRQDHDYTPLIELADIIKIEFPLTDKHKQRVLLDQYRGKKLFLAERVETREEFMEAIQMGYDLFQGYFFCKPLMMKSREIGSLNVHLLRIMEELEKENPDFFLIAETIQRDLGLSFKLLKMANSIYFGGRQTIKCLRSAVLRLGILEMKRWISIMLLREFENPENSELIKLCLLRGKLLSLIAIETSETDNATDFFLAGILSSIDVILTEDMEKILYSLPLSDNVKDALLGRNNTIRHCLDCVLKYERFEFVETSEALAAMNISLERFMDLYWEALSWLKTTNG